MKTYHTTNSLLHLFRRYMLEVDFFAKSDIENYLGLECYSLDINADIIQVVLKELEEGNVIKILSGEDKFLQVQDSKKWNKKYTNRLDNEPILNDKRFEPRNFPRKGRESSFGLGCTQCKHFIKPNQWPDKDKESRCKRHNISLECILTNEGYRSGEWFCKDYDEAIGGNEAAGKYLNEIRGAMEPDTLYGLTNKTTLLAYDFQEDCFEYKLTPGVRKCPACSRDIKIMNMPHEDAGCLGLRFLYNESGDATLIWDGHDPTFGLITNNTNPWYWNFEKQRNFEKQLTPSKGGSPWKFLGKAKCPRCKEALGDPYEETE